MTLSVIPRAACPRASEFALQKHIITHSKARGGGDQLPLQLVPHAHGLPSFNCKEHIIATLRGKRRRQSTTLAACPWVSEFSLQKAHHNYIPRHDKEVIDFYFNSRRTGTSIDFFIFWPASSTAPIQAGIQFPSSSHLLCYWQQNGRRRDSGRGHGQRTGRRGS